ncbi:CBS domain-containing protein CBSCBSPB5 [Zea mays]|uniref:CBS domain-containing protein CBSCBSPB5 n=1 Tax=Zea mays TaxID=4577 RepID=A0A3L6DR50_MAIZE|nr:CBS domain-containing protein CBSCBSPB5 [Zea mays]
MDGGAGAGRRSVPSSSGFRRRVPPAENGHGHDAPPPSRRSSASLSRGHSTPLTGERTVKRLRLSKALTIPDHTTVHEACRRMASRRVDAVLLTDSNALLCGILTDKDITTRVIARELKMEETLVSKVMTRNPVFVLADTLAVEALQKMVQGPNNFIETLRERMFRPSLSTIISENSNIKEDAGTKNEFSSCSNRKQTWGNSDVMTQCPECASVDTPILDALHTMHDGKFLHLPVLDRDGNVVTVVDVLHITHAAIATVSVNFLRLESNADICASILPLTCMHAVLGSEVGNSGAAGSESTSAMMQRFWDSAMSIGPLDDDDDSTRSEGSTKVASEAADIGRSALFPASALSNTFGFKIQDKQGRMHRFNCETSSLTDLITSILQRVGDDIDRKHLPQILYEDEDHDKVILSSDSDLIAAVDHARQIGWKSLRLHLDYARRKRGDGSSDFEYAGKDAWASAYSAVAAGAALVAGLGVMAYLKRSG